VASLQDRLLTARRERSAAAYGSPRAPRIDLAGALLDAAATAVLRARRKRLIAEYLASHAVRKLHLGSGGMHLPGWLNTDRLPPYPSIVLLDLREPFPLPSGAFDYVFGEHVLHYLDFDEGVACLRECRRVLRPGGRIRIALPDLAQIASLATEHKTPEQQRYVEWHIRRHVREVDDPTLEAFAINTMFCAWGFRFMHDRRTLELALERADFVHVSECAVGESGDPELAGLERHGEVVGDEINAFETFVLEAARPAA
jgi:predicted SAM-dependent methyltransferase